MQDLSKWQACALPGDTVLRGAYAVCEPFCAAMHSDALFAALTGTENSDLWTYMSFGPFKTSADLTAAIQQANKQLRWQTMVIRCGLSNDVLGMASYMRIREEHGSAEVGAVTFSKKLQRSRIATDAMYLMARHALEELGYRRYEWKCHNANAASKRAALRFGFEYEGVFRNDMISKGRNRDTAWYAMIDTDWPRVRAAFQAWLAPDNFTNAGLQKSSLAAREAD